MNPAVEQLRRLYRFGFNGERLFNQDGHLDLIHYTRDFQGVREVVLVYSERQALAYRTRDLLDLDNPLRTTDNAVEWYLHGDVVTVVNALLSLPIPEPQPSENPAQPPAVGPETSKTKAMNAPAQLTPPFSPHTDRRSPGNTAATNPAQERRGE